MQAFTCEIKITNKPFLKECKPHQIVSLRPHNALRVIKEGEQRLMMPVEARLSRSTVSLQTEPLALAVRRCGNGFSRELTPQQQKAELSELTRDKKVLFTLPKGQQISMIEERNKISGNT